MNKTIKHIKKITGPSPKRYSDINRRLIYLLGILAIGLLMGVIYFIHEATQPANITVASEDIFNSGMIRIGVRTDLGNYSYRNAETDEMEGFEIDVCEEVLQRIFQDQIVIRYEEITTTTKLSKLHRQELDVCIGAFVPNSSPRISLNYSEGFFMDAAAFVTRKDQRLNILSANKLIVGVLNNSYAAKNIEGFLNTANDMRNEEQQQEFEIVSYACYQDLFDAVSSFDCDVIAVDTLFISQSITDDLMVMPDRMLYHDYCFAFNSRDKELVKVFSEAITAMLADGTIDELIIKWGMEDLLDEDLAAPLTDEEIAAVIEARQAEQAETDE